MLGGTPTRVNTRGRGLLQRGNYTRGRGLLQRGSNTRGWQQPTTCALHHLLGATPTWGQDEGTGAIPNSGGDEPMGGTVREGEWGGLGLSQKKAK
ncbi:hypothetical protein AB0758_43875 [Tolypothrix bouteillei VB521301_2]|uniref:hypothetical protein n=1 Tax=Tolypothrix bouteillei TaxID=1246981 RepID=UPI0010FA80B6